MHSSNPFQDLPASIQEEIREKQRQAKLAKQRRKRLKKSSRPPRSKDPNAATPFAPSTSTSSPCLQPSAFPRSISKHAYFDACPYGVFCDPHLTAALPSVDFLMELIRTEIPVGSDADGHAFDLSKFNYFMFAGDEQSCWDAALYVKLAYEGFFTITYKGRPLPEMQPYYSVVQWHDFNRSKVIKRAGKRLQGLQGKDETAGEGGVKRGDKRRLGSGLRYRLYHALEPDELYDALDRYQLERHNSNWLTPRYFATMKRASERQDLNFQMHVFELYQTLPDKMLNTVDKEEVIDEEAEEEEEEEEEDEGGLKDVKRLVAGEIGYSIGRIYTSLSGWSDRSISGVGYMQLAALGAWLQAKGFAFWSMGHCYCPEMQYKMRIGHRIYPRDDFLKLVREHRGEFKPLPNEQASAVIQPERPMFSPKEECDIRGVVTEHIT